MKEHRLLKVGAHFFPGEGSKAPTLLITRVRNRKVSYKSLHTDAPDQSCISDSFDFINLLTGYGYEREVLYRGSDGSTRCYRVAVLAE